MKTTALKTGIMAAVLMFLFCNMILSQSPLISKTLSITIYAKENYEKSKQTLYAMLDSSGYVLSSMNETKTENGNEKVIIAFYVSEKDFNKIDKCLPNLGYISYKNLVTTDRSTDYDTTLIAKELNFLKQRKTQYAGELGKLKPSDTLYAEVWKELQSLDKQLFEKEKSYTFAQARMGTPHKMQITICE